MKLGEKIKELFGMLDKIDVDKKDVKGDTPLMQASRQNLDSAADLLIKKGSDVNTIGLLGDSPLMEAAYHNNPELMKSLLSAGADVNYYNEKSIGDAATALMNAAKMNAVEVISLLIENKAEINMQHKLVGMTALMFAAKNNAQAAADLLLKSRADLEAKTFGMLGVGKTALSFAAIENHREMISFLIEKGAKKKPLRAIDRKKIPREMVKWLKSKKLL